MDNAQEKSSSDVVFRKEEGSLVEFGPFARQNYYDIENSEDIIISGKEKNPCVEFVLKRDFKEKKQLVFVEAKRTSPKNINRKSAKDSLINIIDDKKQFEEWEQHNYIFPSYIFDVCDKFVDSWRLVLGMAFERYISAEIPEGMFEGVKENAMEIVFLLVITWSKPDWAEQVKRTLEWEIRRRLKLDRKLVDFKVQVLTAEQAKRKHIVYRYTPMHN